MRWGTVLAEAVAGVRGRANLPPVFLGRRDGHDLARAYAARTTGLRFDPDTPGSLASHAGSIGHYAAAQQRLAAVPAA